MIRDWPGGGWWGVIPPYNPYFSTDRVFYAPPPPPEEPMNTANLSLRTVTLEPCQPGEHNFKVVPDDDLFRRADRLVLYCPRCGSLLIHSLEDEDDDAGDE